MPAERTRACALTALCPLLPDRGEAPSFAALVKERLRALPLDEDSPMARVPNTYLCRMFVLDELGALAPGAPGLRSRYLVFVAEIHGRLRPYLEGMWRRAEPMVRSIWQSCVGFSEVDGSEAWVRYVERCQVPTTFHFNGATDEPLAEQLKALYLRQELARFAREHQGLDAATLQRAFLRFVERAQPSNLAAPSWRPGASSLRVALRTTAAER